MAARIDLTLDCANPARLAAFWKLALGYEDEPPPAAFTTREEWLQEYGDPGDTADDGAWLRDPAGNGPRLSELRVPEPKTAKNRLHIDIRAAGSASADERWARITQAADRLTAAGATSPQARAFLVDATVGTRARSRPRTPRGRVDSGASPPRTPPSNSECANSPLTTGGEDEADSADVSARPVPASLRAGQAKVERC